MPRDSPENDPFHGMPECWVVLLARKILSAMMFPKPSGQYYSISELASDLNFAFRRPPFPGGRPETFNFTTENLSRMFNYLKRATFPAARVELDRMVFQIRRWSQDCGEQYPDHPAYVVNKYITYGFILTPNQKDTWLGLPFEKEKLEALQFAHYFYCRNRGLTESERLAAVFDYDQLMHVTDGSLYDGRYDSLLAELADERNYEPDFHDYDPPVVDRQPDRIPRASLDDRELRLEAEERRSDFFRSGPVINGH